MVRKTRVLEKKTAYASSVELSGIMDMHHDDVLLLIDGIIENQNAFERKQFTFRKVGGMHILRLAEAQQVIHAAKQPLDALIELFKAKEDAINAMRSEAMNDIMVRLSYISSAEMEDIEKEIMYMCSLSTGETIANLTHRVSVKFDRVFTKDVMVHICVDMVSNNKLKALTKLRYKTIY